MVIFFAALGLPGLCGFIGEVLVVLSAWSFSMVLAVISAAVVILTAGYILWTIQRVYLGPEYKGPHAEALRPMSLREIAIAAPLVVMAVVLGVFPNALVEIYRRHDPRPGRSNRPRRAIGAGRSRLRQPSPLYLRKRGRGRGPSVVPCPRKLPSRGARMGRSGRVGQFPPYPCCQGLAVNLHELIQYVLTIWGRRSARCGRRYRSSSRSSLLLLARMIFSPRKAPGLPCYIALLGTAAALAVLCLDVHSWQHFSPGQQPVVLPPAPHDDLYRSAGAG